MSLHVPEENKKVSASGEAPLPLEIGTAEARADIDRYGSWEASHQNCVLAMSKNKSTYLEELGADPSRALLSERCCAHCVMTPT